MKIIRVKSYEELSRKAADLIAAQILMKPDCVLGLATGSTPIGTYQNLVKKFQDGALDFSQVTTFNLDEYLGLTGEHPQSYRYFMQSNLFDHVNLRPDCTHVPDGCAEDPEAYGAYYDQSIKVTYRNAVTGLICGTLTVDEALLMMQDWADTM